MTLLCLAWVVGHKTKPRLGFGRPTMAGVVAITGITAAPTGSISGTVTLDGVTQKEDEFLGGKWYSNIHTATNPGGEIRGQI